MRKHIALLMLLLIFFQLSACSVQPELPQNTTNPQITAPQATETDPTTEPTQATTEAAQVKSPLISVSLPVNYEIQSANDGTDIFSYAYQNISLICQDPHVADLVIIDFLNRIDATRFTADRIHSLAQSAYAGQSEWTSYLCMISYNPTRIDPGILSLFGTQAGYYGSTHPETVYSAVNYDLVTGIPLTLGDILQDNASINMLTDAVLAFLKEHAKELYLYEEYESTVLDHFASGNLQSSWYFTEEGLCFYFTPYEIAPYSIGVITATIPYDQLSGILCDAYFPAETDSAAGSLSPTLFNGEDLSKFTRFSELIQDCDGQKYLLQPKGSVRNVRIETGIWSATGSFFTPQHTIYAASALSEGDALMIQADLTTALPTMRLSYETDSGITTLFITADDKGNIQLSEF